MIKTDRHLESRKAVQQSAMAVVARLVRCSYQRRLSRSKAEKYFYRKKTARRTTPAIWACVRFATNRTLEEQSKKHTNGCVDIDEITKKY